MFCKHKGYLILYRVFWCDQRLRRPMAGYSFRTEVDVPLGIVKVKIEGRGSVEVQVMPGDNLGDAAALAGCMISRIPMLMSGSLPISQHFEFVSFDPSISMLVVRKKN